MVNIHNKEFQEKFPHFYAMFIDMCKAVKVNPKKVDPSKLGWFKKHTWTTKQQEEFIELMVERLYVSATARKEIFPNCVRSKKMLRAAMTNFILNYGWKIEDKI